MSHASFADVVREIEWSARSYIPLPAQRYATRKKDLADEGAGNVAFDVDGVIDAFPQEFGTLIAALHAADRGVFIITGGNGDTVDDAEVQQKREFLMSLGISPEVYKELIVVPHPHAENKLKAIKANNIRMLFDNSKANIKAARGVCVACCVWNTKEK